MENQNTNIVVGEDGSYFDVGLLAYIGHLVAFLVVTIITLGIAYPWMRCWYQRWLCEHTVINGKKMTFNGEGKELFAKYIFWLILTAVTCGIYSFWMSISVEKWVTSHIHFEGEPDDYSFFDGKMGDYFVTFVLSMLALLVPFFGVAWAVIILRRWFINHTVIDSRRLTFRGAVSDLFLKTLLWGILTFITCGIFIWFVLPKYRKWEIEHTLDENFTPEALNAKANYKTQVHTDAIMLDSQNPEQILKIKIEMLNDAKFGYEESNLEKLNNALRFADILNECGEEFSSEEQELLSNCEILSRRLKAEKPFETKSKLWVIIVAAIMAFLMFIGVVGGTVAAAFVIVSSWLTKESLNSAQIPNAVVAESSDINTSVLDKNIIIFPTE